MSNTTAVSLRLNPAFASSTREVLEDLASSSSEGAWDDGHTVLRAGERQREVFVLGDGGFELYRRAGSEHVLLGHIEPPRLFGDATLLGGEGVWPVSARARGPTTAVRVPVAAFTRAIERDAGLAAALYRATCKRLWRSIQIRKFIVLHDTEQQVLRLLLSLVVDDTRVVHISQSRLARTLGINRSTAVRALKKLESRGHVALARGEVRVLFDAGPSDIDSAPELARLTR